MSVIGGGIEDRNERAEAQHEINVGRALIMLLLAVGIFFAALLYAHADKARPTWAQQMVEGK